MTTSNPNTRSIRIQTLRYGTKEHAFVQSRVVMILLSFFALGTVSSVQLKAGNYSSSAAVGQTVYIENRGQFPSEVLYRAQSPGVTMWVTHNSLVYDLRGEARRTGKQIVRPSKFMSFQDELQDELEISHHVVRLNFRSAQAQSSHSVENAGTKFNYFLGSSSSQWRTGIEASSVVKLERLYEGVDMVLSSRGTQPRYDLLLAPGVLPSTIAMSVEGADAMKVDNAGNLRIQTSCGELIQGQVYAYQIVDGKQQQVACAFHLDHQQVSFEVGPYDRTRTLVIDPTISTTFLGGDDVDVINAVVRVPSNGNVIAVGATQSSVFPYTSGAYKTGNYGAEDAFVVEYDAKLSRYIYAAYIAGGSTDIAWSAALSRDGKNNLFVCGETLSSDFPVTSGVVSQIYRGGSDAFVFEISESGERLEYSTYHGGSGDDRAYAIVVDDAGKCYYCGETSSTNLSVKSGSYKTVAPGSGDGFAASLSPGGGLFNYSTYLGGAGRDRATDIAFTGTSDVSMVVVGETKSTDFPLAPMYWTTPQCAQAKLNTTGFPTATDAFVTKLNSRGSDLSYSTYLGGNGDDYASAVYVDVVGLATVGGSTKSSNLPILGEYQGSKRSLVDGFLAQVKSDGSVFPYLSYLGGNGDDFIHDLVLNSGFIYVCGQTFSSDMQATSDAVQQVIGELGDGYVIKMRKNAADYMSYYGGTKAESFNSLALVDDFSAYIAGSTSTSTLGTTDSAAQRNFGGVEDGLLTKFCFSNLILASPQASSKYCAGSPMIISWTASQLPTSDAFMLEYSSDDGLTWTTIKTGLVNRSYTWIIPSTTASSTKCKLRVKHSSSGFAALNQGTFSVFSAPSISKQSVDTSVCVGQSAVLRVQAGGDGLMYQWRKDGQNISGAVDSVYSIDFMKNADAGQYDVVISGACGGVKNSNPIVLTALRAPKIYQQPTEISIKVHKTAVFTVVASGTNLRYLWQKYKANIEGVPDSNSLVLQDVSLDDYARYRVIVQGDCGTDTSEEVFLRVNPDDVSVKRNVGDDVQQLHLYPNPSSGLVHLELASDLFGQSGTSLQLRIVNALGEELKVQEMSSSSLVIDMQAYPAGLYHFVVSTSTERWTVPCTLLK